MALVEGTNSYVCLCDADEYFETRIDSSAWHSADEDDKESALITATQIADENLFLGTAVSLTQNLAWPRKGVRYFDPKFGDFLEVSETEVPKRMKLAVLELAYELLANENMLTPSDQNFEEITIGPITLKDSDSDGSRVQARPVPRLYTSILKPLTVRGQQAVLGGAGLGSGARTWWRAN
jgi:hypothetical protein